MKTINKKISAVLLSVYMVFGVISTDFLTVNAFEWVSPSLSFAESLGWLFGSLGIAYQGVESWDTVAPEYEDDFKEYALEHGLNYEETTSWMDEVGNGRLNQASQVWEKFKAWASSLVNPSSSVSAGSSYADVISFLNSYYSLSIPEHSAFNSYNVYGIYYNRSTSVSITDNFVFVIDSSFVNSFITLENDNIFYNKSRSVCLNVYLQYGTWHFSTSSAYGYTPVSSLNDYNFLSLSSNLFNSSISNISNISVIPFVSSGETVFVSLSPDSIDAFSLALQGAISSTIPDVIPLPWDNVGDNTQAINDKMDELLEKVAAGTISIEAFMEAVQNLLGVLTVDISADDVLIPEKPNPDSDEPQKLEDEVAKNKSNSGFVLGGLEKVFPFCIPFDLYAFITLLEAPPVAPVIQYPIYNPITDSNEIITIDFSTWESVVVLFRYIFDFLFIVGMLLIARALIGGGDSA